MKRLKCAMALLTGAALLSACTETPQTVEKPEQASTVATAASSSSQPDDVQPVAPLVSDGDTKIVIYRTSYGGFAVQPKVFVDGSEAAKCTPGRSTTIKVKPGTHRLSAKTLSEKSLTVSVPKGGTAYVRCSISVGLVVGGAKLVAVPANEAAPKAAKLNQIAAN